MDVKISIKTICHPLTSFVIRLRTFFNVNFVEAFSWINWLYECEEEQEERMFGFSSTYHVPSEAFSFIEQRKTYSNFAR